MKPLDLTKKRVFLFDMDGVFYKGKENPVKIGGSEVVRRLRQTGRKVYVLTNNSTDTVDRILGNFTRFGLPIRREEILTSSLLTADYLTHEYGRVDYFLVGEPGFDAELRSAGHRRVQGPKADVVAVGLDRYLTYEKLDAASKVAMRGAEIVATHTSRLYMSGQGPAIGPGPIVRAIEYVAQKKAVSIGKPSPIMFAAALRRAHARRSDAVMIGDQLDTDIAGADAAGIDSILVKTGVDRSIKGTNALGVLGSVDDLLGLV